MQLLLYAQQKLCENALFYVIQAQQGFVGPFYSSTRIMKRAKLNFIVDLVSFIDLLSLAFTGSIMKYILPPGSGGHGLGFRGGRGPGQIQYLWSLTRHEWGNIHFYLAVLFAILMGVHIILHWGWIKNYFKSLLGLSRKTE